MNNKKLTVAIPTHNNAVNLGRAIRSCAHMGVPADDFEILVVDNNSEDDSVSVVRNLSETFNNIRLIVNKSNVGRIGNWNRCLETACGGYIIFLFSNDEIHPQNNIPQMLRLLDENENVSVVFSKYVSRDGEKTRNIKEDMPDGLVESRGFIEKSVEHHKFIFAPLQSCIFRREDATFGFYPNYPIKTDQLWTIKMALRRKHIFFNHTHQFIFNSTPSRLHSQIKYAASFKENLLCHDILSRDIKVRTSRFFVYSLIPFVRMFKWSGFSLRVLSDMLFSYAMFLKQILTKKT
jgi:glycosyltransferase involved in cell wall biosynthesis